MYSPQSSCAARIWSSRVHRAGHSSWSPLSIAAVAFTAWLGNVLNFDTGNGGHVLVSAAVLDTMFGMTTSNTQTCASFCASQEPVRSCIGPGRARLDCGVMCTSGNNGSPLTSESQPSPPYSNLHWTTRNGFCWQSWTWSCTQEAGNSRNCCQCAVVRNLAPTITLSQALQTTPTVAEGADFTFAAGDLVISDSDTPLTASNFMLRFSIVPSADFQMWVKPTSLHMDGNGTQNLELTGSLVSINAAISKVYVSPINTDQQGSFQIHWTANDNGHSDGPAETTSGSIVVSIISDNDPPTIDSVSDVTVLEDSGPISIDLTGIGVGGHGEESAQMVSVVSATSSDTNVILVPVVTYTPSDTSGSVVLTHASDGVTGTSTITVTVTDSGGASTTMSFDVTVLSVNDPPTIDSVSDVTVLEDSGPISIDLTGIGVGGHGEESAQMVSVVSATSSDTNVILVPVVTYTPSDTSGSVVLTHASDGVTGTSTITVTVTDSGGASTTMSFDVTVLSVNDPPTINPIVDQTVVEDCGNYTIFLSGVSAGGHGEEADQTIAISAKSNDTSIAYVAEPNIELLTSDGLLPLTLSCQDHAFGLILVSINLTDSAGGSFQTSFHFYVVPVNDMPSLDPLPKSMNVPLNSGLQHLTVTGISGGGGSFESFHGGSAVVQLSVTSNDTSLLNNPSIIFENGMTMAIVSFAAHHGSSGTVLLTFHLSDHGVPSLSITRTMIVNILPYAKPSAQLLANPSARLGPCDEILVLDGSGSVSQAPGVLQFFWNVSNTSSTTSTDLDEWATEIVSILVDASLHNREIVSLPISSWPMPEDNQKNSNLHKLEFELVVIDSVGSKSVASIEVGRVGSANIPQLALSTPTSVDIQATQSFLLSGYAKINDDCLPNNTDFCTDGGGVIQYSWSANIISPSSSPSHQILYKSKIDSWTYSMGTSLRLPAEVLVPCDTVDFVLSATRLSCSGVKLGVTNASTRLNVVPGGVEAIIEGGVERSVGTFAPIIINASSSQDRDKVDTNLDYQWSCRLVFNATEYTSCPEAATLLFRRNESVVILPSGILQPTAGGAYYLMRLTVISQPGLSPGCYDTERSSSTETRIRVTPNSPPEIGILQSHYTLATPGRIVLSAFLYSSEESNQNVRFLWEHVNDDESILSDKSVFLSSSSKPRVAVNLLPPHFVRGRDYRFRVTAWWRGQNTERLTNSDASSAVVQVSIRPGLSEGTLDVSPNYGFALETTFSLSSRGWKVAGDGALPLIFTFFIKTVNNERRLLTAQSSTVNAINTYLSEGDRKNSTLIVGVEVIDAFGTSTVIEKSIQVLKSSLVENEDEFVFDQLEDIPLVPTSRDASIIVQLAAATERLNLNATTRGTLVSAISAAANALEATRETLVSLSSALNSATSSKVSAVNKTQSQQTSVESLTGLSAEAQSVALSLCENMVERLTLGLVEHANGVSPSTPLYVASQSAGTLTNIFSALIHQHSIERRLSLSAETPPSATASRAQDTLESLMCGVMADRLEEENPVQVSSTAFTASSYIMSADGGLDLQDGSLLLPENSLVSIALSSLPNKYEESNRLSTISWIEDPHQYHQGLQNTANMAGNVASPVTSVSLFGSSCEKRSITQYYDKSEGAGGVNLGLPLFTRNEGDLNLPAESVKVQKQSAHVVHCSKESIARDSNRTKVSCVSRNGAEFSLFSAACNGDYTDNIVLFECFQPQLRPVCSYWNDSLLAWDTSGCDTLGISDTGILKCQCSHLTDFAASFEQTYDSFERTVLEYVPALFDPRIAGGICDTILIGEIDLIVDAALNDVAHLKHWYGQALLFALNSSLSLNEIEVSLMSAHPTATSSTLLTFDIQSRVRVETVLPTKYDTTLADRSITKVESGTYAEAVETLRDELFLWLTNNALVSYLVESMNRNLTEHQTKNGRLVPQVLNASSSSSTLGGLNILITDTCTAQSIWMLLLMRHTLVLITLVVTYGTAFCLCVSGNLMVSVRRKKEKADNKINEEKKFRISYKNIKWDHLSEETNDEDRSEVELAEVRAPEQLSNEQNQGNAHDIEKNEKAEKNENTHQGTKKIQLSTGEEQKEITSLTGTVSGLDNSVPSGESSGTNPALTSKKPAYCACCQKCVSRPIEKVCNRKCLKLWGASLAKEHEAVAVFFDNESRYFGITQRICVLLSIFCTYLLVEAVFYEQITSSKDEYKAAGSSIFDMIISIGFVKFILAMLASVAVAVPLSLLLRGMFKLSAARSEMREKFERVGVRHFLEEAERIRRLGGDHVIEDLGSLPRPQTVCDGLIRVDDKLMFARLEKFEHICVLSWYTSNHSKERRGFMPITPETEISKTHVDDNFRAQGRGLEKKRVVKRTVPFISKPLSNYQDNSIMLIHEGIKSVKLSFHGDKHELFRWVDSIANVLSDPGLAYSLKQISEQLQRLSGLQRFLKTRHAHKVIQKKTRQQLQQQIYYMVIAVRSQLNTVKQIQARKDESRIDRLLKLRDAEANLYSADNEYASGQTCCCSKCSNFKLFLPSCISGRKGNAARNKKSRVEMRKQMREVRDFAAMSDSARAVYLSHYSHRERMCCLRALMYDAYDSEFTSALEESGITSTIWDYFGEGSAFWDVTPKCVHKGCACCLSHRIRQLMEWAFAMAYILAPIPYILAFALRVGPDTSYAWIISCTFGFGLQMIFITPMRILFVNAILPSLVLPLNALTPGPLKLDTQESDDDNIFLEKSERIILSKYDKNVKLEIGNQPVHRPRASLLLTRSPTLHDIYAIVSPRFKHALTKKQSELFIDPAQKRRKSSFEDGYIPGEGLGQEKKHDDANLSLHVHKNLELVLGSLEHERRHRVVAAAILKELQTVSIHNEFRSLDTRSNRHTAKKINSEAGKNNTLVEKFQNEKPKKNTWTYLKGLAHALAKESLNKKDPAIHGLRQIRQNGPKLLDVVQRALITQKGGDFPELATEGPTTSHDVSNEDAIHGPLFLENVKKALDNLLSAANENNSAGDATTSDAVRDSKTSIDTILSVVPSKRPLQMHRGEGGDKGAKSSQAEDDHALHILHLSKRWRRTENLSDSNFTISCDMKRAKYLKQLYISDMRKGPTSTLMQHIRQCMTFTKEMAAVFAKQEGERYKVDATSDKSAFEVYVTATKNDRAKSEIVSQIFRQDLHWLNGLVQDVISSTGESKKSSKLARGVRRSACISRLFVAVTSNIPVLYCSSRLLHAMPEGLGGLHIGRSTGVDAGSWCISSEALSSKDFALKLHNCGWTLMLAILDQYKRAFVAFHEARKMLDFEMESILATHKVAVPMSKLELGGSIEETRDVQSVSLERIGFKKILASAMVYATNRQLDLSTSFLRDLVASFLPEVMRCFPALKMKLGSKYPAPFHSYESFLMCIHEADRCMPLAPKRRPVF